jgi:hypothetical protein
MADREDDAVLGDDRVGVELRLQLFEELGPLCAAESIAGVVVEEHQFAAPMVVDRAAVCQQTFQNGFRDSALL